MKKRLTLFLFILLAASCKKDSGAVNYVYEGVSVKIGRFDVALMNYLSQSPDERESNTSLFKDYAQFLKLYTEHVVPIENARSRQDVGKGLASFFSDPTLFYLYKDAESKFADIRQIEQEASSAFSFLSANLPETPLPEIYFHVSGLNQNVVVGDRILSLSIDKYLGSDYPLYSNYFYEYQRKDMDPERITLDLAMGFLLSEFPYTGNEEVLVNKMIYWGKIKYTLSKAYPGKEKSFIMGYTPEQLNWCVVNQSDIWKKIVGKKNLYSNDRLLIAKYTEPAPHTTPLSDDSPPQVGVWVGWQIVEQYMANNPAVTIAMLLQNGNYVEILKKSRYRP